MASIRAKIAARKISENIRNPRENGKCSIGKILRDSGYSHKTSLKPKLVTESKVFKEELSKLITDIDLLTSHRNLLFAKKISRINFPSSMSDSEVMCLVNQMPGHRVRKVTRSKGGQISCYFWAPDSPTIDKALDLAYKIKGYYRNISEPSTEDVVTVQTINYSNQV